MTHQTSSLRTRSGFSLAETVISVGVTSSVLMAVLGLLSTNLTGARDTRVETAAGILVRRLAAEAMVTHQPTLHEDGEIEGEEQADDTPHIILVSQSLETIASTMQPDLPIEPLYQSGADQPEAAFFGTVERQPWPTDPTLSRLVITVESPASAPAGSRKLNRYVTLAPSL